MGISGHMLSEKSLRRVNRRTGMNFDRAYIRGKYGEGRRIEDGECAHYCFSTKTWACEPVERGLHWSSCMSRLAKWKNPNLIGGAMG